MSQHNPMTLRGLILVLCVLLVPSVANADHRDVCHGLSGDDLLDCYGQADQQLETVVSQNEQLFSAAGLVKTFTDNARAWAAPLINIATAIFWTLALIELVLTFSMMAIRGSDLGEFAVELLTRVLILSFGAYLLSNHAVLFVVLEGFRDTASIVMTGQSGHQFDVGKLIEIPFAVVRQIYNAIEPLNIVTDITQIAMMLVAAVIVLWALAIASVQLILVLCEMYIVITIGLFSLGFFSLKITREYPMRFFGGLIGTGFKLLALELIISIGLVMVDSWADWPVTHQAGPYMLMAAAAIMYKEIAVRIPDYIQSLLTASPGSGISATGAVSAAGAVAGAGAAGAMATSRGASTGVMSVRDAAQLARSQGAVGPASVAAGAIRNLAGAQMAQIRRNSPMAQQLRETLMATNADNAIKRPPGKSG